MDKEQQPNEKASREEAARRRRSRSWAIMIALLGLVALFYAITIVKMAHSL